MTQTLVASLRGKIVAPPKKSRRIRGAWGLGTQQDRRHVLAPNGSTSCSDRKDEDDRSHPRGANSRSHHPKVPRPGLAPVVKASSEKEASSIGREPSGQLALHPFRQAWHHLIAAERRMDRPSISKFRAVYFRVAGQ